MTRARLSCSIPALISLYRVSMMRIRRSLVCVLLVPVPFPRARCCWRRRLGRVGGTRSFRALPDPAAIKETVRRLSARPHHVGSPYDKDNAEWLLAQFKSFGWDAQIETFDVLFPTPEAAAARDDRADAIHGEARRAARSGRPHVGPEERAAADLQRVLHRRRRDGAARLRELRPSRTTTRRSSGAASP